jgi:NAD+ synthase (glutamine-hydrolysing)
MKDPAAPDLDPTRSARYAPRVRIALAQIDTTVGAFEENAAAAERAALAAADQGAQLVVFPELTLPGYPPKDLLELREFAARGEQVLSKLSREPVFRRIAGLVGFAQAHEGPGAGLYNAAALLQDGTVKAVARKILLPTYDVFDEARYFDPGAEATVVEVAGVRVGVSICEDLWNDKVFWRKPRYLRDPIEEMVARGAQCIVNLSASPYALGKPEHRRRMIGAAARRHGVAIAICNLVGGNDSLLFDGRSAVFAADGAKVAEAAAFEEALLVAALPEGRRAERPASQGVAGGSREAARDAEHALAVAAGYDSDLSDDSCAELVKALTLGIRDYAAKTGFRSAVLGLSGGIDSALTAVLAARALGPAQVTGIAMPSRYTASMSNDDARLLAERLGIRFLTLAIEPIFSAYLAALAPVFAGLKPDVTEENLQARIRGTLLMAHSNKTGALLLSTGNKSELGTGFCTLYGDMAGGLAAIGDLPKTAVYAVSRYLNRQGAEVIPERIIDRPPTAELRENQTDQDTLPPYADLDRVLRGHVEEHLGVEALIARGEPAPLVRRVLKLVVGSEYKRRQAAPVLRVSARAFGDGWRFPIAQRYRA